MARTKGSKNRIAASTDFDAQISKLQKDKAMLEEGFSKTVAHIEELKTDIKKFEAAVVEGNRSEAEGAYKVAVKAVDKAVVKGLLHKNNAAHKKSAMTIKLNKLA